MEEIKIPIFRLNFDKKFRQQFYQGCETIFDEAFLSNHTMVEKFQSEFANFCEAKKCLAVSSGTAALEVALRSLDIRGKEVLLPTNTFIATSVAILNAGGVPRPLDIEDKYWGMCPKILKDTITQNTGAVIVVHIGGLISPHIKEIVAICKRHQIPLIEDCAHAHGSSLEGVKAGNFGLAGCFSFFTTKTMTMGEGGAIITNDNRFEKSMKSVRQFGVDLANSISYQRYGSNFKLNEFSALMGIIELKRFKARIEKRNAVARRYVANLSKSNWKVLAAEKNSQCGHYKTIVLSPVPRKKIQNYFKRHNISLTGGVYYIPLHRQPIYQESYGQLSFPVADKFADTHICPPCYPELTMEEVDYITERMLELHK